MIYNYCPICGRKLIKKDSWDEGMIPYCENDDQFFFNTPKPCVVVAVLKDKEIILLKQSYIYKHSKVLISGYVVNGENVEDTVYREVKEETGITIENIKYLGSQCIKDKDLLMLTFLAKYKEGELKTSTEVEWAGWHKLDKAIDEMSEDEVGKKVVSLILDKYK